MNNEDVELEEDEVDGESIVYTSANPFHVRLIHQDKRADKTRHQTSRKRSTSPDKVENGRNITHKSSHIDKTLEESRVMRELSRQNCKLPVKLGKVGGIKCTPEGKRRRRRARFVEPVD